MSGSVNEPWTYEWKQDKLRNLKRDWNNCDLCDLCKSRKEVVFGEGNPDADIMIVGKAPGEEEDRKGEPFVGTPGRLLRAMWAAAGQDWDDVYASTLVSCVTPKNRDPVNDEKVACFSRLQEQIYIVDPMIIVAVGKLPLQYLIGGRAISIEETHGTLLSPGATIGGSILPLTDDNRKVRHLKYDVVPVYDPGYVLLKDSFDEETGNFAKGGPASKTFEDIKNIVERVDQMKEIHDYVQPEIKRRLGNG